MTEIRLQPCIKMVVEELACWCMAVGGSPFVVEVVGGKGGVVMMMVGGAGLWAQLIEIGA